MFENCPCTLPSTPIPDDVDLPAVAGAADQLLLSLDEDSFLADALWRDTFALTGTLRTFYSARSVISAWTETCMTHKPSGLKVSGEAKLVRNGGNCWVEVPFIFETNGVPAVTCSGFLSVVPCNDGRWRIWIMRTILEQLKDQPSVDVLKPALDKRRPADTDGHFETNGRGANHTACTVNGSNADLEHFDSVVVGGGQAGLSTGGRLQALGVSYTILEANAEVGDNWRNRYDSTKLHTVREFSHLPFERTFPDSYPEFLTRLHLAEAYKEWAKRYNINIKLSTKLLSGSWDAGLQAWDLLVSSKGMEYHITCSNIVFAVGASQIPFMPEYANRESFKGTVVHSVAYKSAKDWAGKRGIVIGTANTAHDVAEDMLAARLVSVTMVQRSATYVIPAEHYRETHDRVYNATNPTELADRLFFSGPSVLSKLMGTRALHAKARAEPERFDALERAGFKLDRYGDITTYILERFGGHYMDVGASAKISKGLIKMKSNAPPTGYTEDGLLFDDGSHLKADVIVFATGFVGDMRWLAGKLFGPAVFEQLDEFWGLDDEGELKGAFKPSGHPAFWYHGGALGQARYYARFIALQIKAKVLGTPLPVYNDTPPRKVGLL